MNKLKKNTETGFLESNHSLVAFDSCKKNRFLALANKFIKENGKMPNLTELVNSVGISMVTLERHLKTDERFSEAFREILLLGEDILSDVMFDRAKTPGGYMDRISWLRRFFPEKWHPDRDQTQQANITINFDPKALEEARRKQCAIEAEVLGELGKQNLITQIDDPSNAPRGGRKEAP